MVQLSVLDRNRTAPPVSPTDGDRHIVASGATGQWVGWDLNVAFWIDGVWMRLVPRPGWLAWIAAEQAFVVRNGSAWDLVGEPVDVSDAVFSLVNDSDPTKKALFSLSGITTGTTRTFALPNTSSELAILAGTQTFSGNKTFSGSLTASGAVSITGTLAASGTVTVSAAAASIGTAITAATYGMPRTAVATVATPTLATTGLAASIRRWRVTSAATANAAAEERSAGWVCWRGNADGLGGWNYVNRLSLTTLQVTGMGFFGLYGSVAALATTLTLATVVNCIGIGFQRGTHANWQLVHNDGTGAPTLIDLGASFPVASLTNVLTLYIAATPNGSNIGLRVVEEVSGTAVEFTIATDMPAATQLLSPRNYMNNGATAAAVAYDCAGVYLETDY